MGASTRINRLAALCCVVVLGPQTALAEPDGWLERVASLTRSVMPDINFARYVDRSDGVKDSAVHVDLDNPARRSSLGTTPGVEAPRSLLSTPRYTVRVVDAEVENSWSSLGSSLMMHDAAAADSRAAGLGRSAINASPAPMYGLDVAVNFSDRWSLGMRGRVLDTASSDIDMSVSTYSAGFEFAAKEGLRLGFGYEQFETYSDAQLSTTSGYVSYRYSGPRVFTTVRF